MTTCPLNDADKKWLTDTIDSRVSLQLRTLFGPEAECYSRVVQASNKSTEQNGGNFVNWAEQGARKAK